MTVEGPSEFNWSPLLREVRRGQVVPIVGPELLPYHHTLAPALANDLGVARAVAERGIVAVADAYVAAKRSVRAPGQALGVLLDRPPQQPVPEALRKLASIDAFRLFVTTDYSSLIERAIQERRRTVQTKGFARKSEFDDLDRYPTKDCVVYHLLGHYERLSRIALATVDQLESLYALQSEGGATGLLEVLSERKNLLFLGCSFPEWAAGFVTRMLVGQPLFETSERGIEVVASRVAADPNSGQQGFTGFLRANQVEVYDGDAESFVAELVRRYVPMHPPAAPASEPLRNGPRRGHVFLSYKREDSEPVQRLVQALQQAQVEVWFDRKEVDPGDPFEETIRLAIHEDSAAFVPVLSRNSLNADQGFFLREWRWALDAGLNLMPDVRFIFPVVIDDMDETSTIEVLKRRFSGFAGFDLELCPNGTMDGDALVVALTKARKRFDSSRLRG